MPSPVLVVLCAALAICALAAPVITLDGPPATITLTPGGESAALSLQVAPSSVSAQVFYAELACAESCLIFVNVTYNNEFNVVVSRQTSSGGNIAFMDWTADDGDASQGLTFGYDIWANQTTPPSAPSCHCSFSAVSVKPTTVDIPSLNLNIKNAVPFAPSVYFVTPASSSPMQGFVFNVTVPYLAGAEGFCGVSIGLQSADGVIRESWGTGLRYNSSTLIQVSGGNFYGATGFFPPSMFPLSGYVVTSASNYSVYTQPCPDLTITTIMVPYNQLAVGAPAINVTDNGWDNGFDASGLPYLINADSNTYVLDFKLVAGECYIEVNALDYPNGTNGLQRNEIILNTTNTAAAVAYAGTTPASEVMWTLSGAFKNGDCTLSMAAIAN